LDPFAIRVKHEAILIEANSGNASEAKDSSASLKSRNSLPISAIMPYAGQSMTTLFLAVPGTQETRELPLEAVIQGVASGEIHLDNLAWSPQRKEWVPLSRFPEFAPPVPTVARAVVPGEPVQVVPRTVDAPKVVVAAAATPVIAKGKKGRHAATFYSKPLEEPNEFPVFKVLALVLGAIIAMLVTVNYYLVDKPFRISLAQTSFASVQAHAHLGAFVQPNVLLIHVLPSRDINADNFCDLLTALSQMAPHQAIQGFPFNTISLTSQWRGQYLATSDDWKGFATMSGFTPEEKKRYVLSHLKSISGAPLVVPHPNETEAQQQAERDQAWKDVVSHFQQP
jgi:hypothetical protein